MNIIIKKISERTYLVNGLRFTRCEGRKYYRNTKVGMDLHRYLWTLYFGDIPEGYHIHHKDHNTENNSIENLELIKGTHHSKYHSKYREEELINKWHSAGIEEAKKWHKSDEGREWHRQHYKKIKDKLHIEKEYICKCCGNTFTSTKIGSKFCSNKCKSKWRRDNKIDDEIRVCQCCGKEFTANKYSKAKTCCRSCGKKLSWELKDMPTS